MRFLVIALLLAQQPPTPTLDALVKEIQSLKSPTPPPSTTVIVSTAADLQAALDGPAMTIMVQPGTYTGNFTIKAKTTTTVVQGLTVTGRAAPGLAYPKLVAKDPLLPVLNALPGANDYTFVGLEFTGAAPDRDLIVIGPNDQTSVTTFPQRIKFDQCWIHGVNNLGHRGIATNGADITVTRSYIAEFVEPGRDSQGIGIILGGPYTITDNYIEASGENVMFGGSDPKMPNAIPGPALISGNYFFKPLTWKTQYPGSVKNLFELKNAHDVMFTKNMLENVWVDGQAGSALLITVRNQDGACPWCNVTNVTISCNQIKNVANFAINILGTDNNHPSGTASNISILNNLFTSSVAGIQLASGVNGLTVTGNVMPALTKTFLTLAGVPSTGLVMTGNQLSPGEYGIAGDNTAVGTPSLEKYAPGYKFTGNVIETTPVRPIPYPAGNTMVAPGSVTADKWVCQ